MKFLIVLSLTVVGALSASLCEDRISDEAALRALPALDHEEIHDEFGQYVLRYVTAEGTVFTERGRLVPNLDGTDCVLVTDGEVSYIGDDDEIYTSKFNAGIDGYHVEENHLPPNHHNQTTDHHPHTHHLRHTNHHPHTHPHPHTHHHPNTHPHPHTHHHQHTHHHSN